MVSTRVSEVSRLFRSTSPWNAKARHFATLGDLAIYALKGLSQPVSRTVCSIDLHSIDIFSVSNGQHLSLHISDHDHDIRWTSVTRRPGR